MGRNLVVCLDGTGNQVGARRPSTNVAKTFRLADIRNSEVQLAYYDPGVGTFSSSGATVVGRAASRLAGLAFGLGLKENVTEAYSWLMEHWRPGDRVYLFGFSRGAYAVRVLAGMLNQPGLLRPGSQNLVPYAYQQYRENPERYWASDFSVDFCWLPAKDPDFHSPDDVDSIPGDHSIPITYLGLWDSVSASGILRFDHLPNTSDLPNVSTVRHAVSIDETRAPYRVGLVAKKPGEGSVEETWFSGVHSDVGGTFADDAVLSRLACKWVVDGAADAGLKLRVRGYRETFLRHGPDEDPLLGVVHRNGWLWWLAGRRRRRMPPGARVHQSVRQRLELDPKYRLRLPEDAVWDDTSWPAVGRVGQVILGESAVDPGESMEIGGRVRQAA